MGKLLPVIVGPTAVGKTLMGINLAENLNGEIISADSRQIYIGMEIGNGTPTHAEMKGIPHHLLSIVEPHNRLSSGQFAMLARKQIEDVFSQGKTPIVVGGSGLYIRALVEGLSPIPQPDLELRAELANEVDRRGMTEMIAELTVIDYKYAKTVDQNNKKRLIRALEVYRQTGRTFSDWHNEEVESPPFDPVFIGLDMPRDQLHLVIHQRVINMIDSGWRDEVQRLAEHYGGYERLPEIVSEGIGYKEIISLIAEKIDLDTAIELIAIRTRQFAKRQMTWFRHESRIHWITISKSSEIDPAIEEAMGLLSRNIPA